MNLRRPPRLAKPTPSNRAKNVRRAKSANPVATATTDHATVDRETHRPVRVPAWFVEDVLRAESVPPATR